MTLILESGDQDRMWSHFVVMIIFSDFGVLKPLDNINAIISLDFFIFLLEDRLF